ncbi:MAG: uroporphyrinogen decarboxylase [Chloroflexota bacterium]|nr:uroporphyrinogen decarboxylase [Chloroflexota bacterium]MDE3192553.1 uroporphyrinogen decarboxylase [Chloroflexota bacterium]
MKAVEDPTRAPGEAREPLLVRACRRERTERTPVWFMRQAGRCLAGYRALRERYGMLEMARTPELCARVTTLPVERLGVDAAVLYADIMLPLEGMGIPFRIEPSVGPIVDRPIRTRADVEAIRVIEAAEATPYLFEAIRELRRSLPARVALIGFAGAPFTLASYLVEGRPSREHVRTKAMLFGEPELWHALMARISDVLARYLRAQIEAGAQVVQLFDSWAGALAPDDYERAVLPYSRRILSSLADLGVPRIHFATGNPALVPLLARAECEVVSVDWRIPLDEAWSAAGPNVGIQGNLDPGACLAPFDVVAARARDVLRRAGGRPGHVFNLGHGVLPQTDEDTLARLVDLVRADGGA